jgi:hypothetical protein
LVGLTLTRVQNPCKRFWKTKRALYLMHYQKLNSQITKPRMNKESQNTEWKESWRDEYLKWICGFANAQGGVLFIGKNDKGFMTIN